MIRTSATLVLLLIATSAIAQPTLNSEHLRSPHYLVEYVNTNATFWHSVYDDVWGGFYTNVSRTGSVITSWGTNKDVLTQSRDAYAMVRAFQITGDEDYLTYARGALDFMYNSGWDAANGGWFNKLSETGSPLDPNATKTAFIAHYALLGPMAMVEATGNETDLQWLLDGYDYNETALWDSRPEYFGYYDRTNRGGTAPSGKSFNATVDAVTTHALQLYLLTGDNKYLIRLTELADNMLDRLVDSMASQAIGFAEKYDSDWVVDSGETLTIMGHVLKTAWCLARINQIAPDPAYLSAAEDLVAHVLDNAYDHEFGGPYKDYNRNTGQMQLWGIADTTKAWWQMEQAVVAGLELFRTTGNETYLEMADGTIDFFMRYFQDPLNGEVYSDRTRYGEGIPQWGDHKGDGYKAAYHSIELGYYAYLYATLFLHEDIATLHYKFDSSSESRSISLSPLSAPPGDILIAAVRKDGASYSDYSTSERVLNIPAGVSGHFEVDFSISTQVSTEDVATTAFELDQNFPNPANGETEITFSIPVAGHVTLNLFDTIGRRVRSVVDEYQPAGQHSVSVSTQDLATGMYVYVLKSGGTAVSRTMAITN